MGSYILLTLNGVTVDWGKNRFRRHHYWMFPPGSLAEAEYEYAQGLREVRPAFVTRFGDAVFRMRHLGYSLQESRAKFDLALARWNRTAELELTFDSFVDVLVELDFDHLAHPDNRPPPWEFRSHLLELLAKWDTDGGLLEDFLLELDMNVMLRAIAENPKNLDLPLALQFQDLVDGGWATMDDLTEVDLTRAMIDHLVFFGRLHDHSGAGSIDAFDTWLRARGTLGTTTYLRQGRGGVVVPQILTLSTAVRHMIHHPENPNNSLTPTQLQESIEELLGVAARLRVPLPNLQ